MAANSAFNSAFSFSNAVTFLSIPELPNDVMQIFDLFLLIESLIVAPYT